MNYVIITHEPSIPGSRLSISSLPGSALRTHVDPHDKPRDSTNILKALPGKLDIKDTHLLKHGSVVY